MNHLEWLSRLISFKSISNTSNLELIETISAWFKLYDIPSRILPGPDKSRVNLFVTIPSSNGQINGGILFASHTDVVPVSGQIWDADPFAATQIDNKIYGRGTCDMKGFIAVILAFVPKLKKLQLVKPIHCSLKIYP